MPTTDIDRFSNDDVHEVGIEYDTPTDGLFQVKWPNGNLRYEWYYKDGKQDGEAKGWNSDGDLKQIRTYKDGLVDGLRIEWYTNGQKMFEGIYKRGVRDGLYTSWYEDGVKELEHIYKDGQCIERNDRLERNRRR